MCHQRKLEIQRPKPPSQSLPGLLQILLSWCSKEDHQLLLTQPGCHLITSL